MYFQPTTPEAAETFLWGFRVALEFAGIPADRNSWIKALERRGWKMDSVGVIPGMRAKGLTEMQIMDEFFDAFMDELRAIHDATEGAAPAPGASTPELEVVRPLDPINPDAKLPTDSQRQKLCEMIHVALVEIRSLCWSGKAEQAADLADAFHNVPDGIWRADFSLQFFRDAFLCVYKGKYPTTGGRFCDYVAMVDQIIARKD
jgi:hypothetical protein